MYRLKNSASTSMLEIIDKSYDEEIPDTETYDIKAGNELF